MRQEFSIAKPLVAAGAALLVLLAIQASAQDLQLAAGAPERYTVQRGDTLWGISGKFLKEPWRWPEIWRMNRDQIRNPHWIYPGDVVVLDQSGGAPRLRLERGGEVVAQGRAPATAGTHAPPAAPRTGAAAVMPASLPTVRLSPSIRTTPLETTAIPSIPPGDLEPYLSKPLVTGPEGLGDAAQIVAGRDEHVVRGDGDVVYAAGIDPNAGDLWYMYRPDRVFLSGDDDKTVIGYEQRFLGSARIERFGDISTLRIDSAKEEIALGDRLIPAPRGQLVNYVPHPPASDIRGHVIATKNASAEAGAGWLITIDKGALDGVDVGTVLATYRALSDMPDPRGWPETNPLIGWLQRPPMIKLPEERTGLVFVFRVFDRVSYAVVLRTTDPIVVDNYVRNP